MTIIYPFRVGVFLLGGVFLFFIVFFVCYMYYKFFSEKPFICGKLLHWC